MKRSLPIIIVLAVTAALIIWLLVSSRVHPVNNQSSGSAGAPLQVDTGGGQIFTNVGGDSLQQAAPPSGSATNPGASPQQAVPNYCAPGENPLTDGCVNQSQ